MGKIKRMDQIKSILEVYLDTKSIKGTSRRLGVSKNTVRAYLRKAYGHSEDLSKVISLDDSEFSKIFYSSISKASTQREKVFEAMVEGWLKELSKVGVTRQILWEEYRIKHADGYGYSQFCEQLRGAVQRKDLTLSLDHNPGEKIQIDFAGKKMHWVDLSSGEVHECEILVAVLPYSQYSFAVAVPSQKTSDFIEAINQTFLYFGKLPKVVLSDNLKAFVVQSNRYQPKFNELCIQLATHYKIDLEAARVRKPKDKASVENMVRTIYSRVYAPLRNNTFHSLAELNEGIRTQIDLHNNKPYQKKPGTRLSVFEQLESPVMRDLPTDLFEIKLTTKAKVQRNYHVFLGEEKNYYSVPFKYVGKQATVVYTSKIVEVYVDNQRIAIHERMLSHNNFMHRTNTAHMPRNHIEWKESQGYDAAYFLDQAQKIGEATCWAIGHILSSRIHQSQGYNSCRAILQLAKHYSNERLEKAALRCQNINKASYSLLNNILSKNMDRHTQEITLFKTPEHTNIRGAEEYQ